MQMARNSNLCAPVRHCVAADDSRLCTHCSEPALCMETHSLELHVWLRGRLVLLCEIGTDEI